MSNRFFAVLLLGNDLTDDAETKIIASQETTTWQRVTKERRKNTFLASNKEVSKRAHSCDFSEVFKQLDCLSAPTVE